MPEETSRNSKNNILYLIPIAILLAGFLIAGAVFVGGRKEAITGGAAKSERAQLPASETKPEENPEVAGAQKVDIMTDSTDPSWGPADAKVTIVEFSQFTCPACQVYYEQSYKDFKKEYQDKVRYIYKSFTFQPNANEAAEAVFCANDQGDFWGMHDVLFEKFADWRGITDGTKLLDTFIGYAADLGLDGEKFRTCAEKETFDSKIKSDLQDGSKVGVNATPMLFVNGIKVGDWTLAEFKKIIDEELAK